MHHHREGVYSFTVYILLHSILLLCGTTETNLNIWKLVLHITVWFFRKCAACYNYYTVTSWLEIFNCPVKIVKDDYGSLSREVSFTHENRGEDKKKVCRSKGAGEQGSKGAVRRGVASGEAFQTIEPTVRSWHLLDPWFTCVCTCDRVTGRANRVDREKCWISTPPAKELTSVKRSCRTLAA